VRQGPKGSLGNATTDTGSTANDKDGVVAEFHDDVLLLKCLRQLVLAGAYAPRLPSCLWRSRQGFMHQARAKHGNIYQARKKYEWSGHLNFA